MFKNLQNRFLGRYRFHPEAVIVTCYFNPYNNPYRLKAFAKFYETIKHLNHRIIECVMGDAKPQLQENENISRVYTSDVLWHKEALLNGIIAKLPRQFKYVFWVDADVIFVNPNWLVEGVKELQNGAAILQPFEFCVHLDKDETKPSYDLSIIKREIANNIHMKSGVGRSVWRSFCANISTSSRMARSEVYDIHGHVGFAWGARREVLQNVPLYDRALVGGADHIIAHAAAGQIPHSCIQKAFTEDIAAVNEWSRKFFQEVKGDISYVAGDLYHIWHGKLETRQYLKRIREFTPQTKNIRNRDGNGLYVTSERGGDKYVRDYMQQRENGDGFIESAVIGYVTDSTLMGTVWGGNIYGAALGDALRTDRDVRQHSIPPNYDPQSAPIEQPTTIAVAQEARESIPIPLAAPIEIAPTTHETPTEHWDGERATQESVSNETASIESCANENFS